ncbi:MAG: xylulokinase, partial [Lachnospiraceae bacterium]|nr:xylulokinase [Lachnospiraceae bacterium]
MAGGRAGLKGILPKVPKEDVLGVSFSGQMHGLVSLDEKGEVIRPAMLWCDQRTERQCAKIEEDAGGLTGLLKLTNNRMLTGYTGGKLLWMREKEPENFERMRRFICPKDYIRYKLSGEAAMDVSEASGTGFFNTKERRWSEELIRIAGLPRSIFPEAHESIEEAGKVTRKAAEETGLPEGLPLYYGGGDAVVQTTGTGLLKPGIIGAVIGTAGNVSMGLDRFYDNPNGSLQMFCNNEPGLWHAFGCNLTAGGAYRWYRDALSEHSILAAKASGRNVYDIMGEEAEASVPGAHGVVFTAYLTGERCPYPDANARASFYGMSLKTTRADMTRSVLEGVVYSMKQIV